MSTEYTRLPDNLPAPVDDGAADHLPGSAVPAVALPSTLGGELDLAQAARERIVKAFYPVFPPDRNAGEVIGWLAVNS